MASTTSAGILESANGVLNAEAAEKKADDAALNNVGVGGDNSGLDAAEKKLEGDAKSSIDGAGDQDLMVNNHFTELMNKENAEQKKLYDKASSIITQAQGQSSLLEAGRRQIISSQESALARPSCRLIFVGLEEAQVTVVKLFFLTSML